MLHNPISSTLPKARKSMILNLTKHVGRSGHAFTYRRLFSRHDQWATGAQALSYRYMRPTSIAQSGIAPISTTTTKAFTPSAEQLAIVELCRTQNVIVSARPGAGKTATAQAIVADNPNRPIAVITYSKRLQLATAGRLDAYPCSDAFTFHGLASQLFSTTVNNDSILQLLRRNKTVPTWTGKLYETIILDEMQDCTDDLFWLICVFVSAVTHAASGRAPRIVVLGDERQAIYGFRGADSRYLSLSSDAMATLSPYPWTRLELSKSFRLSHQNSAFVNNVFLGGEQYIVGSHSGPKPLYLHGNVFHERTIAQHLVPLIQQYGPERTAILAPSVRKNVPVPLLTNYLSDVHIPIAKPISDVAPLDDKVLQGKVCVSTYHQFKGSERDLIIIYGVDAGYFRFLARDLPDDTCPNTIFVALTRACKHLVVVHDYRQGSMPFVNVAELHQSANVVYLRHDGKMLKSEPSGRPLQLGLLLPKSVSSSDLARYVPDEIVHDTCARHLQIQQTLPSPPNALHINAPATTCTDFIKNHHEVVSDLNGLAIVAAYEHALQGTLTTLRISKPSWLKFPSNTKAQAIWLCRKACEYEARISRYKSRRVQMEGHHFKWLAPYLDAARDRLAAQFSKTDVLDFEVQLQEPYFCVANPLGADDQTTALHGQADIVQHKGALSTSAAKSKGMKEKGSVVKTYSDEVSIWEIKFVDQLTHEHVIQACTYAYLWSNKHKRDRPPRIILFNVRNGEKWKIVPRNGVASLRAVIEETLVAKFTTRDTITSDEFLEKCARTKAEVEESFTKAT